jgi:uncharacterized protein YqgQ
MQKKHGLIVYYLKISYPIEMELADAGDGSLLMEGIN